MTKREKQQAAIIAMSKAEKLQLYWNVTMARQSQGPLKGITTEQAISFLADLESSLNMKSPLGLRVTDVLEKIIGKRKPSEIKYQRTPDDDGPRAA